MKKLLEKCSPHIYSIMRVVVGFLFACHGVQKLFGVLGGTANPVFSLMGLAGIIEFVGGLLVMLGFLTHIAAFITSGQMAAAYFIAHFPQGFWPIQNSGELAVLYCFVFLYMAVRGAGNWSMDTLLSRRSAAIPIGTKVKTNG